ncbi:tyrosine-type recombinase/integrase [Agathobacter sp.]
MEDKKLYEKIPFRYNRVVQALLQEMPNITPNVCRHTYCSNMAKSGMNPKTLQYLMGHSDIAVTLNVYTHVGLEDAEKELQKMQGLENARKEMGTSDTDDKPLKQNMFKVV